MSIPGSNRRCESTIIGVVFLLIASTIIAAYMIEAYGVYMEVSDREYLRCRERLEFPGLDEADSQHRIVYILDRMIESRSVEGYELYEASIPVGIYLEGYTPRYLAVYYRGYALLGGSIEHTIRILKPDGVSDTLARIYVSGEDRSYGPYIVRDPSRYMYPDGFIRIEVYARSNSSFTIYAVDLEVRFTGRVYGLGVIQVQNVGDVTVEIVALWEIYSSGFKSRRDMSLSLRPGEAYTLLDSVPDDLVEVKVITRRGNIFIGRVKG